MEHKNLSLADQVFERLEGDILSGKYARGQVLTELALCADMGVSRTPIREAAHRLAQEHLVERKTAQPVNSFSELYFLSSFIAQVKVHVYIHCSRKRIEMVRKSGFVDKKVVFIRLKFEQLVVVGKLKFSLQDKKTLPASGIKTHPFVFFIVVDPVNRTCDRR